MFDEQTLMVIMEHITYSYSQINMKSRSTTSLLAILKIATSAALNRKIVQENSTFSKKSLKHNKKTITHSPAHLREILIQFFTHSL